MYFSSAVIVGPKYAGKGVVRQVFEEATGYRGFSPSDILIEETKKRGLRITRPNTSKTFMRLVDVYGPEVLAQRTLERIGNTNVVIEGIRGPADIVYYAKHVKHLLVVGVDAANDIFESRRIRYDRMLENPKRLDRSVSWPTFVENDKLECGPNEYFNIGEAMKMTKMKIIEESVEKLRNEAEEFATYFFDPSSRNQKN